MKKILFTYIFPAFIVIHCLLPVMSYAYEQDVSGTAPLYRAPQFISFLEKGLLRIPAVRDIKVGDVDGDGVRDIIFITSSPGTFLVSKGDGKGNFAPARKHGFERSYSVASKEATYILGDFNGDKRFEILHLRRRLISSSSVNLL